MINLLPPLYKEEFLREKKWKIALNLGVFIFAALICLSLIFWTVAISVEGLNKAHKILADAEEKTVKLEEERAAFLGVDGLMAEVRTINDDLTEIISFYEEKVNFENVFEGLAESLPPESYFTEFSYQKKSGQISVCGFCPTRERLFELKQILEAREDFKDMYFPSSNWLHPNEFCLNFKIYGQ